MTRHLLIMVLVWSSLGARAQAFTIATGFSEGCHEEITGNAFDDFLLDLPMTQIVLPESDAWRRVAPFLIEAIGQDPQTLTERQQYLLVSLLVGVRSPDTDGHSILNLDNLRQLHTDPDPEGQYMHALRAIDDDGVAGDAVAIEGTRSAIVSSMTEAQNVAALPAELQIVTGTIFFDFYERIDVDVWGPAYFVGRAAHTMQDSFAHTIRDGANGLRSIVTVLNFVEAIAGDGFDEMVDGLAHSESMDECESATAETVAAATRATAELFASARELFRGRNADAYRSVLDQWVTYRPGCTEDNGYCDNEEWLEVVRDVQTGTVLCSMSPGAPAGGWPPMAALTAACALAIRRGRRRATRASHM